MEYTEFIVLYKEMVTGFKNKKQERFSTYMTNSIEEARMLAKEKGGVFYKTFQEETTEKEN